MKKIILFFAPAWYSVGKMWLTLGLPHAKIIFAPAWYFVGKTCVTRGPERPFICLDWGFDLDKLDFKSMICCTLLHWGSKVCSWRFVHCKMISSQVPQPTSETSEARWYHVLNIATGETSQAITPFHFFTFSVQRALRIDLVYLPQSPTHSFWFYRNHFRIGGGVGNSYTK